MATQLAVLNDYQYRPILRGAINTATSSLIGSFGTTDQATGQDIVGTTTRDTNTNLELVPVGSGIIDIVHDFDWNGNQVLNAYPKFPKLYMWERTQLESSLVSSYYYYITNIINAVNNTDGVTVTGERVEGIIGSQAQRIVDKVADFVSKAAKSTLSIGGLFPDNAVARGAESFLDFFAKIYQDIQNAGSADEVLLGEFLKSYLGIYFTRSTGFVYVLPYFQNKFQGGTTSWAPTTNQLVLQGVVDNIAEKYVPLISPGAYIEQPKYFNFQQQEGDSIEVEFPLLNTVSETYKKNYELLWILAFQNKYYRQGFAAVRPPKIYTVQLPGVKYFPYAYISNLTIDFAGTRRLLEVETPRGTIEAPVPDAYLVKMKITSLLSDTANALLTDHFHRQVNVNITSSSTPNNSRTSNNSRTTSEQTSQAVTPIPFVGPPRSAMSILPQITPQNPGRTVGVGNRIVGVGPSTVVQL